jgi:hypothetical protein
MPGDHAILKKETKGKDLGPRDAHRTEHQTHSHKPNHISVTSKQHALGCTVDS